MAILFTTSWSKDTGRWIPALKENLPDFEIVTYTRDGEPVDWDAIDYAIVWQPPPGILKQCKNLKAIFNMGAGVDGILANADLPENIPIVRLVDPCLTEGMVEYVVHWVLHFHRGFHVYRDYQAQNKWRPHWYPRPSDRRVGILGLGELGGACAKQLVQMGFDVAGWTRSQKNITGVDSFYGHDQFEPFLNRSQILVCLLPLTKETEGIIDKKALAALPEKSFLINAARGKHVVGDDLVAALDAGNPLAAALDVFDEEPLPADSPIWQHPKIIVTPHVASLTSPQTASAEIAKDIYLISEGKPPRHIVDMSRGY